MPINNAKQLVYYYDGDQANPDVDQDLAGDLTIPLKGSVIQRRGKSWNVIRVEEERSTDGRLPVFHIRLVATSS